MAVCPTTARTTKITTPTTLAGVTDALKALTKGDTETRIFLRGDMHAEYGQLMAVMNVLQKDGYTKIGLVAEDANQSTAP